MSVPLDRLYHYIENTAGEIYNDDVVIYRFYTHGFKNFKQNKFIKVLLALVLALTFSLSQAETYVQINGASIHDQSGYNGFNPGAGLERSLTQRWSVAGGWYYNSEYRGSAYAYGRYAFYKKNLWDIGVAAGLVTGYQRASVLPMAFPEACYGRVCVLAAPRVESTGANVVAARLRIPIN